MATSQGTTKINMQHGFMKSIVRNQVDRDNYDKEVKSKPDNRRRAYNPQRSPKKPNIAVYIPPSRQEHYEEEVESSEEEDTTPKTLFRFEFEDKDGQVYKQYVKEGVRAELLAQRMGYDRKLTPGMIKALEHRLQEEITKRLPTKKS